MERGVEEEVSADGVFGFSPAAFCVHQVQPIVEQRTTKREERIEAAYTPRLCFLVLMVMGGRCLSSTASTPLGPPPTPSPFCRMGKGLTGEAGNLLARVHVRARAASPSRLLFTLCTLRCKSDYSDVKTALPRLCLPPLFSIFRLRCCRLLYCPSFSIFAAIQLMGVLATHTQNEASASLH